MSEVSDEEFLNQINEMRNTLLSMIEGDEIEGWGFTSEFDLFVGIVIIYKN